MDPPVVMRDGGAEEFAVVGRLVAAPGAARAVAAGAAGCDRLIAGAAAAEGGLRGGLGNGMRGGVRWSVDESREMLAAPHLATLSGYSG